MKHSHCLFAALLILAGCSDHKYAERFDRTQQKVLIAEGGASAICAGYIYVMGSVIEAGGSGRDSLAELREANRKSGDEKTMTSQLEAAEIAMKEIGRPPKEFVEAHRKLVELYGVVAEIGSAAKNPAGSYNSFTAQHHENIAKCENIKAELAVLKPLKK